MSDNKAFETKVARPGHVSPELVMDFDCYAVGEESDDVHQEWLRYRDLSQGIFWTPRNGGHWVVTRAEEIKRLLGDTECFSSTQTTVPPFPDEIPPLIPIQIDPPDHGRYRRFLMKPFLPHALESIEIQARRIAVDLITTIAPKGECEFISEFATVLPVNVFLIIMGLPLGDREKLLPLAEAIVRSSGEARDQALADLSSYLQTKINERRDNPGDDLISNILSSEIEGRKCSEREVLSMATTLLIGGLDTVASTLGFIALFLARNPRHRRQLVDDPAIISAATEEFLRRFGVINIGRRVSVDTEVCGALLKKGDMVQAPTALYGLDENVTSNPLVVDFNRAHSKHSAFGHGPHVCIGQHLARRELKMFLEEWLPRIPDFEIDPGDRPITHSGVNIAVTHLPLRWTAS